MKESRRIELEQMLDTAEASGDAKQIRAVRRTIDRVSDQLFGNAGTGAFIVGPDKTT